MVTAGSQKRNVHTAIGELCGNVLHINDITDAGITPGINLTGFTQAQAIGGTSDDIMNAFGDQLRGNIHHEIARRDIGQSRVGISQINGHVDGANHHKQENHDEDH